MSRAFIIMVRSMPFHDRPALTTLLRPTHIEVVVSGCATGEITAIMKFILIHVTRREMSYYVDNHVAVDCQAHLLNQPQARRLGRCLIASRLHVASREVFMRRRQKLKAGIAKCKSCAISWLRARAILAIENNFRQSAAQA